MPDSIHLRVTGHDPIGSPKKFQDILICGFKINAHQNSNIRHITFDFGFNLKENALLSQTQSTLGL